MGGGESAAALKMVNGMFGLILCNGPALCTLFFPTNKHLLNEKADREHENGLFDKSDHILWHCYQFDIKNNEKNIIPMLNC